MAAPSLVHRVFRLLILGLSALTAVGCLVASASAQMPTADMFTQVFVCEAGRLVVTGMPDGVPGRQFNDAVSISASDGEFAVTLADGSVWGWGQNSFGVMGDTIGQTSSSIYKPAREISFGKRAKKVSNGEGIRIVLFEDGTVQSAGQNIYGELGHGTMDTSVAFGSVLFSGRVVDVFAMSGGGFILSDDGTVWSWGREATLLGDSSLSSRSLPEKISTLAGVTHLSVTSESITCTIAAALVEDGSVWVWGGRRNCYVKGDGTAGAAQVPVKVAGLDSIVDIAAGNGYCLALSHDGTVWAWGESYYGSLGTGDFDPRPVPAKVKNLTGVVAVSCGPITSFARTSDGRLWGWGSNYMETMSPGMSDRISLPVELNVCGSTSVADFDNAKNAMRLFPNPTTGTLTIEIPQSVESKFGALSQQVTVTDVLGVGYQFDARNNQNQLHLDVQDLPSGIYTITTAFHGRTYSARLVKQ